MLKVIDAELRGNVVRLYLGDEKLKDWHGDDWDDYSYEDNCSVVYDDYVAATVDIAFPFDWNVAEPSSSWQSSNMCRNDFKNGIIPLFVAAPFDPNGWRETDMNKIAGMPGAIAVRMGDRITANLRAFSIKNKPTMLRFSAWGNNDSEGKDET